MSTLDKEEFRIKLEEINKLIEKKDYEGAMAIVDSIDWRKVKNIRTLCVVVRSMRPTRDMKRAGRSFCWHIIGRLLESQFFIA